MARQFLDRRRLFTRAIAGPSQPIQLMVGRSRSHHLLPNQTAPPGRRLRDASGSRTGISNSSLSSRESDELPTTSVKPEVTETSWGARQPPSTDACTFQASRRSGLKDVCSRTAQARERQRSWPMLLVIPGSDREQVALCPSTIWRRASRRALRCGQRASAGQWRRRRDLGEPLCTLR